MENQHGLETGGESCLELYRVCRPDPSDPVKRVFLTEEMTWTRNEALAHHDFAEQMLAIARKIRHAYPEMFLEKTPAESATDAQ